MRFVPALAFIIAAPGVFAASPAGAAPAVVPPLGGALRFHVERTTHESGGVATAASDVTLRRKAATALTIDGTVDGGQLGLTVLTIGSDGLLSIPSNDSAASQNVALNDVVRGLDRAIELFAGRQNVPADGWGAKLSMPEAHGAIATVPVTLEVTAHSAGDVDFEGAGQLAQTQGGETGGRRGGGRRGGFHGGGFPGGGGSPGGGRGGERSGESAPSAHLPFDVAVSVEGRIDHGALAKVTFTETRSVTVDGEPFANVSGWSIEAVR